MSNLHGTAGLSGTYGRSNRIFGSDQISRACKQALKGRDHGFIARTSIAAEPHEHRREIERRKRQQAARNG